MPAPKPATDHLAEMLERNRAKLVKLRKRREAAHDVWEKLNEEVEAQEKLVEILAENVKAIENLSVVGKAMEEA